MLLISFHSLPIRHTSNLCLHRLLLPCSHLRSLPTTTILLRCQGSQWQTLNTRNLWPRIGKAAEITVPYLCSLSMYIERITSILWIRLTAYNAEIVNSFDICENEYIVASSIRNINSLNTYMKFKQTFPNILYSHEYSMKLSDLNIQASNSFKYGMFCHDS